MTNAWDAEFSPSAGATNVLMWAQNQGAYTLGEAYDMLEHLEVSNDIPEVLGHDDTFENVREDIEYGIETVGADTPLATLI